MSFQATERFGVAPAPGGLVLVQDLVNSAVVNASSSIPDLLASLDPAQAWAEHAVQRWSAGSGQPRFEVQLSEDDVAGLREIRERARVLLDGHDLNADAFPAGRVEVQLSGAQPGYGPTDHGWRAIAAVVAFELFLGARSGTLPRLKACANPVCGSVFYDLSRNSSRIWHDTDTCGNAINTRAYRARQKQARG